ncbi:hypothetical protein P7K49_015697 [Saguinus oedipus]|uniref:Uncharacterized protein n=1 Tax=Saguinus oedipus TaxID=9490 RepID=A0ABQ9VA00_SAGOE|nr:hypothetical protein P7K49_015697 [Saguinus oedipus]
MSSLLADNLVLCRPRLCLETVPSPLDCLRDIFPFYLSQRKNPVLNFSAQPLPLPPKLPLPGPGQYELVDYLGPQKRFISSASFVSNTSRWTAAPSQPGLPGPERFHYYHTLTVAKAGGNWDRYVAGGTGGRRQSCDGPQLAFSMLCVVLGTWHTETYAKVGFCEGFPGYMHVPASACSASSKLRYT